MPLLLQVGLGEDANALLSDPRCTVSVRSEALVSLGLAAASYAFIEKPNRLHGRTYAKRVAAWSARRGTKPRHVATNGKQPT